MERTETLTTNNWEDTLNIEMGDELDKSKYLHSGSTKEYTSFSYHPQNRKILPHKIKVIAESIARFGNCGIIKTRESKINSDLKEVFDGQHLLEACKLLKIPVHYAHFDNVPLRVMIELNKNATAWKLQDYLEFCIGEGLEDYIILNKYIEENEKPKSLGISSLICLLNGRQNTKAFKSLGFKVTRKSFADKVISYLHDFSGYIEHWNHTKFIWAFCDVVESGKYIHSHMMNKVTLASDKFRNASGVEGHRQAIEDMYNFRSRTNIVRFM